MKVFITSALPYCNNTPHLGNLIGSTLSGDFYARFCRMKGDEVIYLCGTDEYGSTTTIKAKQEGVSPKELCDKYHQIHKDVYDWFNIQFDVWGRTSTEEQTKITQEIFLELYKNGFIEEKTLVQMYCEKCNIFLADRYVKGTCYHPECNGKESIANGDQCDICQKMIDVNLLVNPFCNICKEKPVPRETEHLFLKLGELSDQISGYLDNNTKLKPNVLAIAKAWLNNGLTSRCITRDLEWGTPIPKGVDPILDKYQNKVFYVWFDAPFGYYSILAKGRSDWKEWLSDPNIKWISTQAKDNIPFHTIVFPASILGSKLPYPLINEICGTDYLLYEGEKFSKSNGVGLFGDQVKQLSKKLGINEDYWRFYLAKIRPESQDSSFSMTDFVNCIRTDLVNNIGNFINRCFSMAKKFTDGTVCFKIDKKLLQLTEKYTEHMENFRFREALKICLELSSEGNQYIQSEKPWDVIKADPNKGKIIIGNAVNYCWTLLRLLIPFIPHTAEKILSSLEPKYTLRKDPEAEGYDVHMIVNNIQLPFRKFELDDVTKALNTE